MYGRPIRDMTEIESVKIILVQQHIYDSVRNRIFNFLCYFPLPCQNKKEPENSRKSKSFSTRIF